MPFLAVCWVWFDFGTTTPAVQSLYSKLIGKGNAGLYFSVLQSNGAVSRMISGQLVAFAYGVFGAPYLWAVIHVFWVITWVMTQLMWRRIDPEAINAMHRKLNAEQQETFLPQTHDTTSERI